MDEYTKHLEVINEKLEELFKLNRILDLLEEGKRQVDCPLLSSTEACNYLRISRRTLARLTASGELSYTKSGRKLLFSPSDIETFLENKREGGSV